MRSTSGVCFLSLLLLSSACATGSPAPRRDAGGDRMDAAPLDGSASDDGGASPDASAVDASLADAAGADAASPADGGSTGPVTCTAATAATRCGAAPCVDGFCCDSPCSDACRACDVAGSEGLCTLVARGSDPDDECATTAPSSCGTTGACDGAGACAMHAAATPCDDSAACTTGDACDGAGTCRGEAPAACAPAAGNECCVGSCDASSGCVTTSSPCADVCGAAELRIGRACSGCGAARAAGLCGGGAIRLCNAASHSLCESATCGGTTYYCTESAGSWGWRSAAACSDGDACTHGDVCGAGLCRGTAITCTSTTCMTRTCDGTATCAQTPRTGTACDDGDACTYGDACNAAGMCTSGMRVTCADLPCLDRECNGTAACTETPRTGLSCEDGNLCTYGETCSGAGACVGGASVSCDAMDTTCRDFSCNGTATCASMPRNVGMSCDDGMPGTMGDRCQADGTCVGGTCPATLTTVFTDDFASPSSASWSTGTDAALSSSRWRVYTSAQHGVRIDGGRLEITNQRSSSGPSHGHGFAYVVAGGAGAHYDTGLYDATLASNTGEAIVWTLNMRRDDPEGTSGGFRCTSTSSQNNITVGLAYVLATDSMAGLNASTSTCSSSGAARGYAVVLGGSNRIRLVRFEGGLRNGTLTDLVTSGTFTLTSYFSVRVTYDQTTNGWRLEVRSDGSSTFSNPASGSFTFSGTATDATHVSIPLLHSGPYFQSGCSGLCSSRYTTRFDNVTVGVRCAP